ncbi:MAG: UDP-N-acetylglucosamine 1-carboxyvinyltransferase [Planctomycetaceae bacterium]|nr:UDP-N-acetylglucosamine 1-carboxyvinyltransferase [Planctomycetaceae bacterium]
MAMDIFKITGPVRLDGTINVSNSKNAALPVMAATILAGGKNTLIGLPNLSDIAVMGQLMESLGCKKQIVDGNTIFDTTVIDKPFGDYEIVRKMRAGICILGPLLARCGKAEISLPGGCAIGYRPVDIHVRGLQEMGAKIELKNGYIVAHSNGGLKGANIFLGGPFGSSVLATANILSAAVLAKGKTIIEYAACEPEVTDLANCLVKMGAKITGIGSPQLIIHGVKELKPIEYKIIPDRIEAGTFLCAAAITKGKLKLKNCRLDHLWAAVNKLRSMNVKIDETEDGCEVECDSHLEATDLTTLPYPGFPTDLQAQFMACLCLARGNSVITEKIFEDRFMHVAELSRMSANLRKEGPHVIISGVEKLTAAPVMASDLRASAALVVAALAAHGETIINRVYHIDRGYEKIEEKLNACGANIQRLSV